MAKFSFLQGLLILAYMWTHFDSAIADAVSLPAGSYFSCNETHAKLQFIDPYLNDIGVCDEMDWLLINNVSANDVRPFDNECKFAQPDGPNGSLVWKLDQCKPNVMQDDNFIYFCWFARNAEGGQVQRFDKCQPLYCNFTRWENITSQLLTMDLLKTTLDKLSDIADITVELKTFASAQRAPPQVQRFNPPGAIFVSVCIVEPWVPDSFWVQIFQCWVLDDLAVTMEHYSIIENGAAVATDPKANVVVGPFGPNKQDFQFDSFIWTNPQVNNINQFWIVCKVYLCNNDAAGVDCNQPQFPVRRRRHTVANDDMMRSVVIGPIKVEEN